MIGRQRIPPTKSYFSRMAQTPCHATVHILVAALTHWRYGLTSQLAVATLVPSGQCAWLVGQSGLRRVSWPAGQLNRPDELSRRYPSVVSTPSAGTSCGSAGKSMSNTSHGQHTAIRGHAGLRRAKARSYQPAPRPRRLPCGSTAKAGAMTRSAFSNASAVELRQLAHRVCDGRCWESCSYRHCSRHPLHPSSAMIPMNPAHSSQFPTQTPTLAPTRGSHEPAAIATVAGFRFPNPSTHMPPLWDHPESCVLGTVAPAIHRPLRVLPLERACAETVYGGAASLYPSSLFSLCRCSRCRYSCHCPLRSYRTI